MNEEVKEMKKKKDSSVSEEIIQIFIEERTRFINDEVRKQGTEAFQIWEQEIYKNNISFFYHLPWSIGFLWSYN